MTISPSQKIELLTLSVVDVDVAGGDLDLGRSEGGMHGHRELAQDHVRVFGARHPHPQLEIQGAVAKSRAQRTTSSALLISKMR
jgi:metallophosphoesterase superfamily enzyme